MYKKLLIEDGMSRRDQVLAQGAFYSGARCVLKVLDHLLEHGDADDRHGRTIRVLQGKTPRKRFIDSGATP
jgi:hypothetical protein